MGQRSRLVLSERVPHVRRDARFLTNRVSWLPPASQLAGHSQEMMLSRIASYTAAAAHATPSFA